MKCKYRLINLFIIVGLTLFISNAYSQQKQKNIGASVTTLRNAISTIDEWPTSATESTYGTTFDSTDYQKVRVYVKISDTSTTCTIRPMIWNSTASNWFIDSPNTVTGTTDQYSFVWESRHASSLTFLIDTISGSGNVTVYVQGSNL